MHLGGSLCIIYSNKQKGNMPYRFVTKFIGSLNRNCYEICLINFIIIIFHSRLREVFSLNLKEIFPFLSLDASRGLPLHHVQYALEICIILVPYYIFTILYISFIYIF
jgi:hypothetical protein